jgi:diadenosine tetraphosphate (Ap4A) HIT family hydrolase
LILELEKIAMPPFALHPQIEADSLFLRDLPLSQLRLQNQSAVPWLILVPRRADVQELHLLSAEDRQQAMDEITLASRALSALFAPDKINVGALGNVVPQLHIHVLGRFKSDPAWPAPVWGKLPPSPYSAEALADIQKRLKDETLWR